MTLRMLRGEAVVSNEARRGLGRRPSLHVRVNVAVDVGVEPGQVQDELLHRLADGVEALHDGAGVGHAADPDGLAQVPDGDARRLQVADVGDGGLGKVDERLEGAGQVGDLDQVTDGPGRGGLGKHLRGGDGEEGDEEAGQDCSPARGEGAVLLLEEHDGGLDWPGALEDLGADGEADVWRHQHTGTSGERRDSQLSGDEAGRTIGRGGCSAGEVSGSARRVVSPPTRSGLGLRRFSGLMLPGGRRVRMACSSTPSSSSSVTGDRGLYRCWCCGFQKPRLRSPSPRFRQAGGEYPPTEAISESSMSSIGGSLRGAGEWRMLVGLGGGSKSCKEASRRSSGSTMTGGVVCDKRGAVAQDELAAGAVAGRGRGRLLADEAAIGRQGGQGGQGGQGDAQREAGQVEGGDDGDDDGGEEAARCDVDADERHVVVDGQQWRRHGWRPFAVCAEVCGWWWCAGWWCAGGASAACLRYETRGEYKR